MIPRRETQSSASSCYSVARGVIYFDEKLLPCEGAKCTVEISGGTPMLQIHIWSEGGREGAGLLAARPSRTSALFLIIIKLQKTAKMRFNAHGSWAVCHLATGADGSWIPYLQNSWINSNTEERCHHLLLFFFSLSLWQCWWDTTKKKLMALQHVSLLLQQQPVVWCQKGYTGINVIN